MKYVFIHGLGQGPESWNAVLEGFDGEGLCPDLFGLAGAERSSYGGLYRAFAAWCRNQGAVCLCGLSLGGVLALHYALERPEQVRALALIGTQFAMPTGMLRLQNAVFRILPEGAFREMGLGKREAIALARSMETLDFRKDLGRISCPALVVCGTRDRANRRERDIRLTRTRRNVCKRSCCASFMIFRPPGGGGTPCEKPGLRANRRGPGFSVSIFGRI